MSSPHFPYAWGGGKKALPNKSVLDSWDFHQQSRLCGCKGFDSCGTFEKKHVRTSEAMWFFSSAKLEDSWYVCHNEITYHSWVKWAICDQISQCWNQSIVLRKYSSWSSFTGNLFASIWDCAQISLGYPHIWTHRYEIRIRGTQTWTWALFYTENTGPAVIAHLFCFGLANRCVCVTFNYRLLHSQCGSRYVLIVGAPEKSYCAQFLPSIITQSACFFAHSKITIP